MQLSQIPNVAATVDDPNLISSAGLVPVMRLDGAPVCLTWCPPG